MVMSKNKGSRIIITIECSCRSSDSLKNRKSIFRYTTSKNRHNTPHRIELRKFCPKCNSHRTFKEIK